MLSIEEVISNKLHNIYYVEVSGSEIKYFIDRDCIKVPNVYINHFINTDKISNEKSLVDDYLYFSIIGKDSYDEELNIASYLILTDNREIFENFIFNKNQNDSNRIKKVTSKICNISSSDLNDIADEDIFSLIKAIYWEFNDDFEDNYIRRFDKLTYDYFIDLYKRFINITLKEDSSDRWSINDWQENIEYFINSIYFYEINKV